MDEKEVSKYLDIVAVQQYKSDIGFRTLVESVNDNMYIIPKYQRKYRWSKEQVIGLVESLLKGFPIPPIYTCRNSRNQLEILDGQQRVMSLFFYYIGYFLNKNKESAINFTDLEVGCKTFAQALKAHYPLEKLNITLKGLNGEKINVDYASLPIEVKRQVDYRSISVIEIKIGQEEKREKILQAIFKNLNANGSPLSRQEQRNGIYMCGFYDMLQEFNKRNKKWRKLWGRENSKDKDLETLLRFCALRKYVVCKEPGENRNIDFSISKNYDSYAAMCDSFSEEAVLFANDEIEQYRKSLDGFVNLFDVNTVLAAKVALMEGFYIVYEKLGVRRCITRALMDSVQSQNGYKENSGQRTVNMKKMKGRWNAVYEIWNGAADSYFRKDNGE